MMCVIWDMQLAEAVRWCEHSLVNPLTATLLQAAGLNPRGHSPKNAKKRVHQIYGNHIFMIYQIKNKDSVKVHYK